ncbi:MAG: hypothetical protein CMC76_11960 [Flavobacteriaceae bacterium]|nr:hypothetical protein [Flavobacteriaceae bacterium]|tara:strand:- start:3733 stop:3963 length:231 start_codon:yes stop_codon:yes gene_type:complete
MQEAYNLKRMVFKLNQRKPSFDFLDQNHKELCNAIALKLFNGNYRKKPSSESVFNFAKMNPNDYEIHVFLSGQLNF